jgi:hypothetical protein
MSTTGSGSDLSSPQQPIGSGSSPGTDPRVILESILIGRVLYLGAHGVEMMLMDMHLRARNDGERELVAETVEQLRKALRNG